MKGKLPSRVPHASRYRVFHRPLQREVEFRVEPRTPEASLKERYFLELHELTRLDHPAFMPVLERGMIRGRHCYVVPYRRHRTIPQRIAQKDFYLTHACATVRGLGNALAALHEAELRLGPVNPNLLAWDDSAGAAYVLHHRSGAPLYLKSGQVPLPEDIGDDVDTGPRADVYHWGFLAYYLLSRGVFPYKDSPRRLVPLAQLCPQISRHLAMAVQAALSWDPERRPEDGPCLRAVLQAEGLELRAATPTPTTGAESSEEDLESSRAFVAAQAGLEELHLSTAAWGEAAPAAVPSAPSLQAAVDPQEDEEEDEDDAVDVTAYQSSTEVAAVDSATVMARYASAEAGAAAALDDEDNDGLSYQGPSLEVLTNPGAEEGPPPQPATGTPGELPAIPPAALLAALLLGVGAGWGLRGLGAAAPTVIVRTSAPGHGATAPAATPAPGTPAPLPAPRPDGALRALAPSKAALFQGDPQVRELLLTREVPAGSFPRVWRLLRNLVGQNRLPQDLRDFERVAGMRALFKRDQDEGCKAMGRFLDDLRLLVGEAPKP